MIEYDADSDVSKFDIAANDVQLLTKRPTNDELLFLYGLYKQSTCGNNHSECPNAFDIKAKAKWSAWKNQSGKGKTKARKEYINFVEILKIKY